MARCGEILIANEEQFYYNIDLETGKELTLLDLLGPDFKAIVNQSVKDQSPSMGFGRNGLHCSASRWN